MVLPEKTSAEAFGQYLPGTLIAAGKDTPWTDVLVEISVRRRWEECLVVPAVAEPLIVWILSGRASVEEREFGGSWSGRVVSAGDFFLTTTPRPYELRWRVTSAENFEVMHAYIGLPVFGRACKEVLGVEAKAPRLRDVSGERDAVLSALMEQLRAELTSRPRPSQLFIQGIAQSLAVHLVRAYPAPGGGRRGHHGGLPAFKLRKVTGLLEAHLAEKFTLARLATEAGYSAFHFSRLFKQTTGFSLSQYQIRARMVRARRLMRETTKSMIEIGLEVGYISPSHFAHAFRREVGVTPSEYRGGG